MRSWLTSAPDPSERPGTRVAFHQRCRSLDHGARALSRSRAAIGAGLNSGPDIAPHQGGQASGFSSVLGVALYDKVDE
jgi:hypothetical protein